MADNNSQYVVIGNSIVRYLDLPDIDTLSFPGHTLFQMRQHLERPGTKLLVSGIPDILRRGETHAAGPMIVAYERTLREMAQRTDVILCPFYPPRSLSPEHWGIVNRLNHLICDLNSRNDEGTPCLTAGVFGRQANSRDLYFRPEKLRDEAHPGRHLATQMSETIKLFIRTRERRQGERGEARVAVIREGEDARARIEANREHERRQVRQEPRVREEREEPRRDIVREEENRQIRQEPVVRRNREELRRERDREEENIRRSNREEMERALEEVRTEYGERRHRLLEQNNRTYQQRMDELEREEEDREREERQQRERDRDRIRREAQAEREEPRFRNRDIRENVPSRRYNQE